MTTDVRFVPSDSHEARDLALLTGPAASGILAAALEAHGGDLVSYGVQHVALRPGGPTTVSYETRVRWPDGRVGNETWITCTGEPPAGALVLDDGDRRIATWRFPHDPLLPGLAVACDPAAVVRLLGDLGVGHDPVQLRVRAYRPRHRAVIEAVARHRLFLKVVRPEDAPILHERHQLLRGCGVPVPASLGWTPEGILVLRALPGRSLRRALCGGTAPIPSGDDILAMLDRLPDALARYAAQPSSIERARQHAAVIGAALPGQAARAIDLAEAVAAGAGPGLPGPVHGDFYEGHVLIDAGRVGGLLDVDDAGPGDRLDDLACLLAHMSVLVQVQRDRAPFVAHVMARYLASFEAVVPAVELRYRVAAVAISLATGCHRAQEPNWPAATRRRLDLAHHWLVRARTARVW